MERVREQAKNRYHVKNVVQRYTDCIEEIINIPTLMEKFWDVLKKKRLEGVISEIVLQSRIEFNVDEDSVAEGDVDINDDTRDDS